MGNRLLRSGKSVRSVLRAPCGSRSRSLGGSRLGRFAKPIAGFTSNPAGAVREADRRVHFELQALSRRSASRTPSLWLWGSGNPRMTIYCASRLVARLVAGSLSHDRSCSSCDSGPAWAPGRAVRGPATVGLRLAGPRTGTAQFGHVTIGSREWQMSHAVDVVRCARLPA